MRYLTAEEIKELKEGDGREILENCAGKSVRDLFAVKIFNNYIDKFFKNRTVVKLLDLGPASGVFASQIGQVGYKNIYGIDIDDYVTTDNKKLFKEFRIADLSWEKLPWPDNFFQVATAWCVIPHLENPFHAIREIHRVLDKNGILIFTVPNLGSKGEIERFKKTRDFKSYRATNNHIVIFTENIIKKTVLKFFKLIGVEYHVRPKIFNGFRGKIRRVIYILSEKSPPIKQWLGSRWGVNVVYILQK
ncbi:MAG: class I SAM-dependent methyltransferase [Candidatus Harrisonbacteria bacterium]|nr:class I SAM-dependent methyltransferase [Candidatus Harrisonbacteria bacterium]